MDLQQLMSVWDELCRIPLLDDQIWQLSIVRHAGIRLQVRNELLIENGLFQSSRKS